MNVITIFIKNYDIFISIYVITTAAACVGGEYFVQMKKLFKNVFNIVWFIILRLNVLSVYAKKNVLKYDFVTLLYFHIEHMYLKIHPYLIMRVNVSFHRFYFYLISNV